jgi:hypothetical protein
MKIVAAAVLSVLALTGAAEAKQTPCSVYDRIPAQFRQTPAVDWYLYKMPLSEVHTYCGNNATACTYPCVGGAWALIVADDVYSDEETACLIQDKMAEMPPNNWNLPVVDTGTPLRHNSPTLPSPTKPTRVR